MGFDVSTYSMNVNKKTYNIFIVKTIIIFNIKMVCKICLKISVQEITFYFHIFPGGPTWQQDHGLPESALAQARLRPRRLLREGVLRDARLLLPGLQPTTLTDTNKLDRLTIQVAIIIRGNLLFAVLTIHRF